MPTFVVLTNQRLTNTTQLLTLQNKNPKQPFHFKAGQYAAINFWWRGRPTSVRCFSIVNPPTDQGLLQLGIQIKGRYTKAITLLQLGDKVNVHGAYGSFVIDKIRDQKIVLLAGGIGITPFVSIIRYLTRLREDIQITLLYSCRDEHDVPFADELLALEQLHSNFRVVFMVSGGVRGRFAGKKAASGRITAEIMDKITGRLYMDKTFFICGSTGFMDGMKQALLNRGTPAERVIMESFTQTSAGQRRTGRNWPQTIYGLTSAGLVIGLMIVMFTDFVRTMPTFSVNSSFSQTSPSNTKESPAELNRQVNTLLPPAQPGINVVSAVKSSQL